MRRQSPELFQYEGRLDSGEDRFEDGRLEQPRTLPVLDLHLAHGQRGWLLTGNRHDEEIWPCPMVGAAANHHGGTTFDGGLIGEGKGTKTISPNS